MSGGITIYELADSLKQQLFDSNGSIIAHFSSRKIITSPADEIEIGIDNFDSDMDCLYVYKNSVSLSVDLDYTISDNKKIVSTKPGEWGKKNKNTIFDFIVIKNIKDPNRVGGVDLVDAVILENGTITKEKLSQELYNKIYCLPEGGTKGSMLVKNSDQDFDVKWTTNTVCNVVVSTFDNKPITGCEINIRDVATGIVTNKTVNDTVNIIDLVPGNTYEISVGSKDGYVVPAPQQITPVLGVVNTLYFMYNTTVTTCSINLETEDNQKLQPLTVYLRRVSDGNTLEIHTDGVRTSYDIEVLANAQYEIYASDVEGYVSPAKKVINTTSGGISTVLIRYTKDEVFCDLEITGLTLSPENYVTVTFKDLKTDVEYNHQITMRNTTVTIKSNTSYEIRVNEDKPGFIKPANRYIRTGQNKSNISVPLAYQLSTNTLNVNVFTDDDKSVEGVDVTISDGVDFTKVIRLTEEGKTSIQVANNKSYTISVSKLLGYNRPNSQTVVIENSLTTVNIEFKKVNIYGFVLDLKNSDPKTSIQYIEDSVGFKPMSVDLTGKVTYGDWLSTFVLQDVRPVALLDGHRVGYLSLEEEGRMESGEQIPPTADLMAEFKKKYYSVSIGEDKLTFKISNYKVDASYNCSAFISDKNGKDECDYMYYGMYEASVEDSKLHSKRGRTVKKFEKIDTFRTLATAKGEGYNIESIEKINYITLITMLISRCADIKAFIGKIDTGTNGTTAVGYSKFRLCPPNRTLQSPINLFFINNMYNSQRFIDGCYMNGLKEIRYKKTYPYNPETNYSLLPVDKVQIGENSAYINHVKNLCVGGDIVFPEFEKNLNNATVVTYFGSRIKAAPEADVNKKLILDNQGGNEGEDNSPGFFNFSFISESTFGARLTYCGSDER